MAMPRNPVTFTGDSARVTVGTRSVTLNREQVSIGS